MEGKYVNEKTIRFRLNIDWLVLFYLFVRDVKGEKGKEKIENIKSSWYMMHGHV